ncbi:hypothetical protein EVAR_11739_1 [Eumeta japonica]|uniref:Endonuclease/exonuclease/phosphatase domain-containing protein n=1 Tax=Eumeta variegata TaxID=151549 RepID=A0A4C1UPY7_EUMVA|nr:hypothetical protein EVAR_11739_1 [Eumeta japonica]
MHLYPLFEVRGVYSTQRYVYSKLGNDKIILGVNVNAWSVWWSSERDDAYGDDLCDFLDSKRLHVLNDGNTLTFKRRGMVRDVKFSDYNAITFAVRVERCSDPRLLFGTRVYNTAKARWSEFETAMDFALNERTLTVEMVKSVGSCNQLDEVVETYTKCIQQACDAAIPRRSSKRGLKPLWWSPELKRLKKDVRPKKLRIRNAVPSRREYVVGKYVQAKKVYERAVAKA